MVKQDGRAPFRFDRVGAGWVAVGAAMQQAIELIERRIVPNARDAEWPLGLLADRVDI